MEEQYVRNIIIGQLLEITCDSICLTLPIYAFYTFSLKLAIIVLSQTSNYYLAYSGKLSTFENSYMKIKKLYNKKMEYNTLDNVPPHPITA